MFNKIVISVFSVCVYILTWKLACGVDVWCSYLVVCVVQLTDCSFVLVNLVAWRVEHEMMSGGVVLRDIGHSPRSYKGKGVPYPQVDI